MGFIPEEKYKINDLPTAKSGEWSIRRFEVDEHAAKRDKICSIFSDNRCVPVGTYTGLYRGSEIIMSDTPNEIKDHCQAIYDAYGNVLIVGLGLEMYLNAVAQKTDVDKITVIEKSKDVLAMVQLHYERKYPGKIEFICADIFDYKPAVNAFWDYAWFDIWDDLNPDNIKEMSLLHRRYSRKTGKRDSWGRKYLLSRRY
jgi:hypothetical protein